MSSHVAFLRGVNVGGHGLVKMEALRAVFEEAGAEEVRTYIQSGNVIFGAPASRLAAVERRIAAGLVKSCGLDAPIAYRELDALQALVKSSPFSRFARETDSKLYVAFLVEPPRVKPVLPRGPTKDGVEVVEIRGREVFLVCRPVKGSYGFPNNSLEKDLGVAATTRNWNTVVKIVERFA